MQRLCAAGKTLRAHIVRPSVIVYVIIIRVRKTPAYYLPTYTYYTTAGINDAIASVQIAIKNNTNVYQKKRYNTKRTFGTTYAKYMYRVCCIIMCSPKEILLPDFRIWTHSTAAVSYCLLPIAALVIGWGRSPYFGQYI